MQRQISKQNSRKSASSTKHQMPRMPTARFTMRFDVAKRNKTSDRYRLQSVSKTYRALTSPVDTEESVSTTKACFSGSLGINWAMEAISGVSLLLLRLRLLGCAGNRYMIAVIASQFWNLILMIRFAVEAASDRLRQDLYWRTWRKSTQWIPGGGLIGRRPDWVRAEMTQRQSMSLQLNHWNVSHVARVILDWMAHVVIAVLRVSWMRIPQVAGLNVTGLSRAYPCIVRLYWLGPYVCRLGLNCTLKESNISVRLID